MGQVAVYPQPSVLAFIQSDQEGMWGRNCPTCEKYFRTNHIMGLTCCPYCSHVAPDLAFVSKRQKIYLTACYDAFARAFLQKESTAVKMADISDETVAWHYSEEKQQFHFTCHTEGCKTQTDILGQYGFCPRCGHTNARRLFLEQCDREGERLEHIHATVSERREREEAWERITIDALSRFEALAKHMRRKLIRLPMTPKRADLLQELNIQQPLTSAPKSRFLRRWCR